MARMLDCLVSYFGLDEHEHAEFRRYFSYHIVAGPGPTPEAGIAVITALAVHDEAQRCTSCQNVHKAKTGGPAAAIAAAIRYLDAYHAEDRLWKVQSELRGLPDRLSTPAARKHVAPRQSSLVAME